MLSPFLGFLCYVLGTKLGGVLLFRMSAAGSGTSQQQLTAARSRQEQAAAVQLFP